MLSASSLKPLALAVLLGLAACVAYWFLPGVFVASLLLCLALVFVKPAYGLGAYVLFTVVAVAGGGVPALGDVLFCVLCALFLWRASGCFSIFDSFFTAAAGVLCGLLSYLVISVGVVGINPVEIVRTAAIASMKLVMEMLAQGQSADMLAAVESLGRDNVAVLNAVFRDGLGSLAVTFAFMAGIALLMTVRGLAGKRLPRHQTFAFYQVPRIFGLAVFAALVIFFIASMFDGMWMPIAGALQSLFSGVYMLQGMAVILFMLRQRKLGRGGQAAIAALLIVVTLTVSMAFSLLMMLGLLENFIQLRLRMSGSGEA